METQLSSVDDMEKAENGDQMQAISVDSAADKGTEQKNDEVAAETGQGQEIRSNDGEQGEQY